MLGLLRPLMLAAVLTSWATSGAVFAQASAPAKSGPPPGFVAQPEPKPEENNAQRAKTQPGNNAPFWRQVRESGNREGYTSLPGLEMGTLVQEFTQYPGSRLTTAGEAWRQVRNYWIIPYGGALLLIVGFAIALFHWRKGPLGHHESDSGRVIERFTPFERTAHWANAIAFVVLAVSGLVMAFGKFILLPLIGGTLFGWLTYVLKTAHNFAGPLFAVSLVIVVFTFLRDEVPQRGDTLWLRKGGGMLSGEEVPSHRFNAGEKVVFWIGVVVLGAIAVGSGLVLDKVLPGIAYTRADMQVAHMVHGVATILMMVLLAGHIYLGTAGVRGAYKGMRTGYVDEAWAQEHHALWYADVKEGKIPALRSPEAKEAAGGRPAAQV